MSVAIEKNENIIHFEELKYLEDQKCYLASSNNFLMGFALEIINKSLNNIQINGLENSKLLENCYSLTLESNEIDHCGLNQIINSSHLKNLKILKIRGNTMNEKSTQVLSESENLAKLEVLYIYGNDKGRIGDNGLKQLLSVESKLTSLKELYIAGNLISSVGAKILAKSHLVKGLNVLNIGHNKILDGIKSITTSEFLSQLQKLDAGSNGIENEGVIAIIKSPYLINLTFLDISGKSASDLALIELVRSERSKKLSFLNITQNVITKKGLNELFKRKDFEDLTVLKARSLNLNGHYYVKEFETKILLPNLRELYLGNNELDDQDISNLFENNVDSNLEILELNNNLVTEKGLEVLVNSFFLQNLKQLSLDSNNLTVDSIEKLVKNSNMEKLEYLSFNNSLPDEYKFLESYSLETLKAYFKQQFRYIDTFRILLLGDGRVGKTSTKNSLLNIQHDEKENITLGISIY
ncbi:MAG: hypothetical protein ACRCXZ_06655, partial [Patescibacteria group bacterium]